MAVGFGFAGSGLLIFYYFGLLSVFTKEGVVVPGLTPLGGLSGGAVTAIQTCAQVPVPQMHMAFKMALAYCRDTYPSDYYCNGMLDELMKEGVRQNLDTYGNHKAAKQCTGKLYVSISLLNPLSSNLSNPVPWTVSKFSNPNDMTELAASTGYLSCFSAYQPYVTHKGWPVIDGGYSSNYKDFCPPRVSRCIKVASYVVGPNNPTGQAGCNHQKVFLPRKGAVPSPVAVPPSPHPPPRSDWRLPTKCTYDQDTGAIVAPLAPGFVTPSNPDIYPGFSPLNPLTVDPCIWQSWSLNVTKLDANTIEKIYDTGVKDAQAWLQQNPAHLAD